MPSEKLASGENLLKGELAAAWNILEGSSGDYTDLGVARRFGGSAAAYSLRDIGAMNGRVVRVRRDSDDTEEDFSANQVASGALEDFVQDGAAYNEFSGDFDKTFSPEADGTFTPNGQDGFTLAVVSSTVYAGIKLNADVTSGDSIYVSFNCSFDAGSPSPKIALRDTDSDFFGGGTLMSNEESVVNGFNSFTLTSTNSSASGVVLSEADNNLTYSISDFKVSRISRNGFVETWYDQSSSGNNATQTTSGKQPKVVENGGIVKNVKGFSSVKFESANSTELDIGLLISNLNSVSGYVVTQKDDGDTNVMAGFTQGVSSNNSRFYLPFYTGGTTPNFGYNNSASKISFGTTSTGTCNLYSVFSGDTNIEAFKNGSSVGTTALVDQDVTATNSKIGQLSNSFYLDGVMSEIFLTTQKLQSDADTINSDVTSYYNL